MNATRWTGVALTIAATMVAACGSDGGTTETVSDETVEESGGDEAEAGDVAEGPSAGAGTSLSESGAQAEARRAAEEAGYDLTEYRLTSTTHDDGEYTVHFEQGPPTPPGGHFAVIVDERSGETRIMPGE